MVSGVPRCRTPLEVPIHEPLSWSMVTGTSVWPEAEEYRGTVPAHTTAGSTRGFPSYPPTPTSSSVAAPISSGWFRTYCGNAGYPITGFASNSSHRRTGASALVDTSRGRHARDTDLARGEAVDRNPRPIVAGQTRGLPSRRRRRISAKCLSIRTAPPLRATPTPHSPPAQSSRSRTDRAGIAITA